MPLPLSPIAPLGFTRYAQSYGDCLSAALAMLDFGAYVRADAALAIASFERHIYLPTLTGGSAPSNSAIVATERIPP
jgi:hypothetical protein